MTGDGTGVGNVESVEEVEKLEKLAEEIEQGRDHIAVPAVLVEDPVDVRPATKNLAAEIQAMSIGERLKLALKGNRDARTLLIRDSNRIIQRFVLQNPRITEDEIVSLAKNRSVDRELLAIVCKKKEWLTNYQVRLALVTNPKTPMAVAVRLVPLLLPRDLRQLAKSKNVPIAVNGVAKRLVIERAGGREEKRG
jgi:hypothetical protein